MEGTVDDEEPHVRPGLANLPAQPGQLVPPLLPELRGVLGAGASEETVKSEESMANMCLYLMTVSVELCSISIGVLT